jgi:Fe-S oxidoreductase
MSQAELVPKKIEKEKSTKDHFREINRALECFKEKLDAELATSFQTCVRCGLCAETCHYYLIDRDPRSTPAYKLALVKEVFKKSISFSSRAAGSSLPGATVDELVDVLFGRCSLCGRCFLNCTMGINITRAIRIARGMLACLGLVPEGLASTVNTAVSKGNNMGISKEDWLETVEWLEEELQAELNDSQARLPVDKKGARVLYAINPREAMFFPMSITAAGKIFYAARESWTFSSENFDVTNYGLYSGEDDIAGELSARLIRAKEKLGCEEIILAECGHGYNSNRWEVFDWLRQRQNHPVRSILELIAEYIRETKIKLDPARNPEPITLHDPCNLVRLGGIIEEQRYILKKAVTEFREMTPNRERNYCCGGGGGQLAMTRFAERRIKVGQIKAEQIRQTRAKIVATPCHNCIDQLMELNKHYQLKVTIKTITEIVAQALVI